VSLSEFGVGQGRLVAGSGAPPPSIVTEAEVEPHGWLIIAPS
jgi:cyclomaltodextrinase / maltogenic alpha-amylase / neopullulanase